jgi:hypothetical protein
MVAVAAVVKKNSRFNGSTPSLWFSLFSAHDRHAVSPPRRDGIGNTPKWRGSPYPWGRFSKRGAVAVKLTSNAVARCMFEVDDGRPLMHIS